MTKTIIYSGPGPSYKGVVRSLTDRLFETDWVESREKAQEYCRAFLTTYQPFSEAAPQITRQKTWDF